MTRAESAELSGTESSNAVTSNPNRDRVKYKKDSFINHAQMDYIEVSLNDQAFHLVCMNKRQNCWITTASKDLTKYYNYFHFDLKSDYISLKFSNFTEIFSKAFKTPVRLINLSSCSKYPFFTRPLNKNSRLKNSFPTRKIFPWDFFPLHYFIFWCFNFF